MRGRGRGKVTTDVETAGGTVHSEGGNCDRCTVSVVRWDVRAMLHEWPGLTRGETHPCECDIELVRITQFLLNNSVTPATHRSLLRGLMSFRNGMLQVLTFCFVCAAH